MVDLEIGIARVGDVHVPLPRYATAAAAGMDLHAALASSIVLAPRERRLIPTGLRFAIPTGYEAQIRPRSGLALRSGIGIVNAPGTIDSDFRGEVGVVLINHGSEDVVIAPLDRIAQMVVAPVSRARLVERTDLDETQRGAGGYGSTGRT